jgi:RNA polymerase sigma-70 factor (ECF subfamily)
MKDLIVEQPKVKKPQPSYFNNNNNYNTQAPDVEVREVKFKKGDLEDIQALGNAINGNKDAFGVIFKKYKSIMLYKITFMLRCDKQVAEDIMMDIFEKVYKNMHKYQPQFTFNAWLSKIAKNHLIDHIRKTKAERFNQSLDRMFSTDDEGGQVTIQIHAPSLTPEQELISKDGVGQIQNIVCNLKKDYQILFKLRFIEQRSYEDIADICQMSVSKIKTDLFRLRQILITNIKKNQQAEALCQMA